VPSAAPATVLWLAVPTFARADEPPAKPDHRLVHVDVARP
jgi:hypothetical protein